MESFVNLIKNNLDLKMAKNPSYSLRSYAKHLGISPATLSGVINGKRKLSPDKIGKIGLSIGLSPEQIWNYQRETLGIKNNSQEDHFNELSQDLFIMVSNWYHLAILEVMKLNDFQANEKWIANRLKIKPSQVKFAIERLQRIGILEITKNNVWIDKMNGFTSHYQKEKTSEARKNYQRELLEKSLMSLNEDDYSVRDHSSTSMAIHTKDIGKAKDLIKNFRQELSKALEKNAKPNEVYQLQISFFPLTKEIKRGSK